MGGWQEIVARPKAATADWIVHLERGATNIMALQKWGVSDDIGAAVLRGSRSIAGGWVCCVFRSDV